MISPNEFRTKVVAAKWTGTASASPSRDRGGSARRNTIKGAVFRTNPNRQLKNWIFITVTVLSSSLGNVFLAIGLRHIPPFRSTEILTFLVSLLTNSWLVTGTALLIIWMITQLIMFTWADLSYVLPVTAIVFILTAILSKVLLQEQLSISRWAGVGLISFAVILVAETPPRTNRAPGSCG